MPQELLFEESELVGEVRWEAANLQDICLNKIGVRLDLKNNFCIEKLFYHWSKKLPRISVVI